MTSDVWCCIISLAYMGLMFGESIWNSLARAPNMPVHNSDIRTLMKRENYQLGAVHDAAAASGIFVSSTYPSRSDMPVLPA